MDRLLLVAITIGLLWADMTVRADPANDRALVQQAHRLIADYHAGQPRSSGQLRVVYFVPNDGGPLRGHAERLDRVMTDVSHFYRDGLLRYGLKTNGLPLEQKDGRLVIHEVRGKLPASQYHHESGDRTADEIKNALKGTVDLDREHVLVFYGLCRKESSGRYVFDAPYYGRGSQWNGLCHAADCELLDPTLLTDTSRRMIYSEHYYPRVDETVAQFNSKYLGGTAHELGHCLGLPHDDDRGTGPDLGASLMGRGNLTYRQDAWRGGPPAYLAVASALKLIAHPVFTGSNRGRWETVTESFGSLVFAEKDRRIQLRGTVTGAIPAYAAVAYVWPTRSGTDHGARTFPAAALKDGAVALELDGLAPDTYQLRLVSFFVNGAATSLEFRFGFDARGKPDVGSLNASWIVDRAELAVMNHRPEARPLLSDKAIARAPSPEAGRKLRLLREALDPPRPIDLATVKGNHAFLSDVAWATASVGWGHPARNAFWFDERIQHGVFLMLGGRFHDKGLYAHSPSRYTFAVNRRWKTFNSAVGIRDGAAAQGSAIFIVVGDGRELYRSGVLRVGSRETIDVDISQVGELELRTEGGEGHNHNSWAVWVDAEVRR